MAPPIGPLQHLGLAPPGFGSEIIYSFVIIVCSLMIYHATKEMYELSSYKGINYFRKSFLFFAIAYFFRSFIKLALSYFNVREIFDFSPIIFGFLTLLIFMYASSMAIFYLAYSVMWKKWNHSKLKIYLFNILAVIIAFIGLFMRTPVAYLLLNMIILVFVSFILSIAYKDFRNKKKGKNLFIIYMLLFIFWILNVIDILIPRFLEFYQMIIYLVSILLFMTILYKVLKKSGN